MVILATRDGRVDCRAAVPLGLSTTAAWGQLRDFARYASHDYFHADVRVAGGVPRQGVALRLRHVYASVRVERVGRILRWREGHGWAYSDLSRRGPRRGFPHVLAVTVEPAGGETRPTEERPKREGPNGKPRCVVRIEVRGRWTAGWVPLVLRRLWLAWVFAYVVSRTRNELLAFQAARERRRPDDQDAVPPAV